MIFVTQRGNPTLQNKRVLDAVNFLIEAPNCSVLIMEMRRIIERWDTQAMAYGGQLVCLNAMLDVGLHDRDAFERLVRLVQNRRVGAV